MGSIAQTPKYNTDRLDRNDSLIADMFDMNYSIMQSVQKKTLLQINEKLQRQEAIVCALQTKVFDPKKGPVGKHVLGSHQEPD